MKSLSIGLAVLWLSAAPVFCQARWTGATNTDWADSSNWTGGVPTSAIDATIPMAPSGNYPDVTGTSAACRNLVVDAGASLNVAAGGQLDVYASVRTEAALTGAGFLRMRGTGSITGSGTVENLEVASSGIFNAAGATVTGDFVLSAGRYQNILYVMGDALLQGGNIDASVFGVGANLDVRGDVTFAGVTSAGFNQLRLGGDLQWDAGFAANPFTFTTLFDGTNLQLVQGPNVTLAAITVRTGAQVEARTDVQIAGQFQGLRVETGGMLDLGAQSWSFEDLVQVDGTLIHQQPLRLLGQGSVQATQPLGSLDVVASGTRTLNGFTMNGDLTVLSGTVNGQVTVNGTCRFQGGSLDNLRLFARGDVEFTGTSVTGGSNIDAAGDFRWDGNYTPNGGRLDLNGTSLQVLEGTGTFLRGVLVRAGAQVEARSDVRIAGQFQALTVEAGGTLDLGTRTWSFEDALTIQGTLIHQQPLRLLGQGAVVSTQPLGSVEVLASGTRTLNGFTMNGDLTVSSGVVNGQVTVNGTCRFQGGSLDNLRLFARGDVEFTGTSVTGGSNIDVAGDFRWDGNYTPNGGRLDLNGTSLQVLEGTGTFLRGVLVRAGAQVEARSDVRIAGQFQTLTVESGGTLDLGTRTWSFEDALTIQGTLIHQQPLRLLGQGAVVSTQPLGSVEVIASGTRTLNGFTMNGDLTVSSGVVNGQVTVNGTCRFQGGSLDNLRLFARGDVEFTGTGVTVGSNIDVAGDFRWDGNYTPNGGRLTFNGTSLQVLEGTGTFLRGVLVKTGAQVEARSDVRISGQFNTLTIESGATMDLTTSNWSFEDRANVSGMLFHERPLTFVGFSGISATTPVGDLVVSTGSSIQMIAPACRDLTVRAGTVEVAIADVAGDLSLEGGTTTMRPTTTIQGDVSVLGGALAVNSTVKFEGDWTSDASYTGYQSTVHAAGEGFQQFTLGGAILHRLIVDATSTVEVTDPLHVVTSVDLDGILQASAVLDVDGNLDVDTLGIVILEPGRHCFAGGVAANGKWLSRGTVVLDGTGTVSASPASRFGDVEIAGTGNVDLSGRVVIEGSLTHLSGTLRIDDVQVHGTASFQGGALERLVTTGVLDLESDATFAGTTAGANPPLVTCAGNWTSDVTFAPPNGRVILDGATATMLAGADPTFHELVVREGTRFVAGTSIVTANTLLVETDGELRVASGGMLTLPATTASVDGTLGVDAGGTLALGAASSVTIASGGSLDLDGSVAQPAAIVGDGGGGYAFAVNGFLRGMNFRIEAPGAAGFQIGATAQLASAPYDFRNGTFDLVAATNGATLLDLAPSVASTFHYLTFEDTNDTRNAPGLTVHNVRASGVGPFVIENWAGVFGGDVFEDDPQAVLTWAPPQTTQVSGFTATGGPERATLGWQTTAEVDVERFLVERSDQAMGAYTLTHELLPLGGGTYQVVDTPLAPSQTWFYRLSERLTHGEVRVLGMASATPFASGLPANVATVGPNGLFPDLQSALDRTSDPRQILLVESGTYPPFTIQGTGQPRWLRIVPDGSGPIVIDTDLGPVRITGTGPLEHLELNGLTIGDVLRFDDALYVEDALGTVVIDECTIAGGAGFYGLVIANSSRVAVQRCDLTGFPGLLIRDAANAVASRGSLDELVLEGNSQLTLAELTPTRSSFVEMGSTLTPLPGRMPDLDAIETLSMGQMGATYDFTFTLEPGNLWALYVSSGHSWFTLAGVEMPLLLDVSIFLEIENGLAPPASTFGRSYPVVSAPSLLGASVPFQCLSIDPVAMRVRWSNVDTVTILP